MDVQGESEECYSIKLVIGALRKSSSEIPLPPTSNTRFGLNCFINGSIPDLVKLLALLFTSIAVVLSP